MPVSFARRLKTQIKHSMRIAFEVGQRFKVDILPLHFYSEVPDIRLLRSSQQWRSPRTVHGVLSEINKQVSWVDAITKDYRDSLRNFEIHRKAIRMNGSDEGYGEVES